MDENDSPPSLVPQSYVSLENVTTGAQRLLSDMVEQVLTRAQQEQNGIPADKIIPFIKAATALIEDGLETPHALAKVLDEKFPDGRMRKYSQALWDAFGLVNPSLRGTHDWTSIYQSLYE